MPSAGDLVRKYRAAADMTLEDVGLAVGLTPGAVNQWETGRTSPRRAAAFRVDELLGAGGKIAAAFGYKLPENRPDDLKKLRAVVRSHGPALEWLLDRVAAMTGEEPPRVEAM